MDTCPPKIDDTILSSCKSLCEETYKNTQERYNLFCESKKQDYQHSIIDNKNYSIPVLVTLSNYTTLKRFKQNIIDPINIHALYNYEIIYLIFYANLYIQKNGGISYQTIYEIFDQNKELFIRKFIELPRSGRLISRFCTELAELIKERNVVFYKPQENSVVELRKIPIEKGYEYFGFSKVESARFIGLIEQHVKTFNFNKDYIEIEKSMSQQVASITLNSPNFQENINIIQRIFTVPIPIIHNNTLVFPHVGYDKRFQSWLVEDTPRINPNMPIDEAKNHINFLLKEFCFETPQDKVNAIAALLTPFLKGLLPDFNTRTPIFFYMANRERAGKDYLAGLTGILYEGQAVQEPPISSNNGIKNDDELRKKITSSLMAGRKRLHFANNTGFINSATLEAVATAEVWSDRQLGKNTEIQLKNELMFSLSGNTGITFTADFMNRARFIKLFLAIENANEREFTNPQLDRWLLENRSLMLSSFYALVREWDKGGRVSGGIPFSSFPAWANICGGVMEYNNLGSPCMHSNNEMTVGGDTNTQDIKTLFEKMYQYYPNQWIKASDVRNFLETDDAEGIFSYLDLTKRPDQTRFGMIFKKYIGRIFSNIMLESDGKERQQRAQYRFVKVDATGSYVIQEEPEQKKIDATITKQTPVLTIRDKIINSMSRYNSNELIDQNMITVIVDHDADDVDKELKKLSKEGLVYSPKAGFWCVVK